MNWWPVLLGWPAVLTAVTLSVLGIYRSRPAYLYAAMVLILPISLYLAGAPRFSLVALFAPLAILIAAKAIKQNRTHLALGMVLPVIFFFGWLALLVLR